MREVKKTNMQTHKNFGFGYLNNCLLERMSFQDSSARAPDRLNNSKSFLKPGIGEFIITQISKKISR